jgi:hypothetical protein
LVRFRAAFLFSSFILCVVFSFPEGATFSIARVQSSSGIYLILVRRRVSTYAFPVPSQRLGVGSGYNSAGHVQQECGIGERGVLYSPQHQCAAGKGVERGSDLSWIDVPKRHDLIVGKHVIIKVFAG